MIIKKYVLAAMQCCDTKKMFHFGSKRWVRAQQSECGGIKTLSQRYDIHDSCLYSKNIGYQQSNVTLKSYLHDYCKKKKWYFLRIKCTFNWHKSNSKIIFFYSNENF